MSNNLFMRGEPFDLSRIYYIIGRKNNNYYYFTNYGSESSILSTMISTPYTSFNTVISPIPIKIIKKSSPNFYSFTGNSLNYPLISTNNIIDLKPSGVSTIFELFAIDAFSGSASDLYPGIWYSFENSGITPRWNTNFCLESSKGFCNSNPTTQNDITTLEIMFIPYNITDNSLTTLNSWSIYNGSYQCTQDSRSDVGLYWFESFIKNTGNTASKNCETNAYINSNSNNCYFSESDTCHQGFLYSVCLNNSECGNCLGICDISNNNNMKACKYDFSITSEKGISPLSCNPKKENSDNTDQSTIILIILCIFILLIIIFFCIFIFYKIYKNKNN